MLRWLLILTFLACSAIFFFIFFFSSTPASDPLSVLRDHHGDGDGDGESRFLEVPQIAWGLNNQKIALARALLTARFLNRSLLLPSLSASLTYKDTEHIAPLPFDHLFSLPHFNRRCSGFVRISQPAGDFFQRHPAFDISKGSGRRWTKERDLQQLVECRGPRIHSQIFVRISGKNPFLWHDHWPARDYARVFRCLSLVKNISADADYVVSKLKQMPVNQFSRDNRTKHSLDRKDQGRESLKQHADAHGNGYVAVHMRVELDWMIHCRKTEERLKARQSKLGNICSSKQEITNRVGRIPHLQRPAKVYLAVADVLLKDKNLLEGWDEALVPLEKNILGLMPLYEKYPYIIQSALDYEICLRADVFIGNSFSTFSSLIVLERSRKMLETRPSDPCSGQVYPSYAYNVQDESGGPQLWVTNLSDTSLHTISYGTDQLACDSSALAYELL